MRRTLLAAALMLGCSALLAAGASAGVSRHYTVYATDGYVTMPDGNQIYTFGFNDTGIKGQVVFPSPLIWANVGDEVSVTLINLGFRYRPDLTDPHTVHLHGMHVTPFFDGFPESSWRRSTKLTRPRSTPAKVKRPSSSTAVVRVRPRSRSSTSTPVSLTQPMMSTFVVAPCSMLTMTLSPSLAKVTVSARS